MEILIGLLETFAEQVLEAPKVAIGLFFSFLTIFVLAVKKVKSQYQKKLEILSNRHDKVTKLALYLYEVEKVHLEVQKEMGLTALSKNDARAVAQQRFHEDVELIYPYQLNKSLKKSQ